MLLYWNSIMAEHKTGAHPECPARLLQVGKVLESGGWMSQCTRPTWKPATLEQLSRVHQTAYLKELPKWCESNAGRVEEDTVVSERSFEAASIAAGAACDAVERVVAGQDKTAFAAIRPPGHHALAAGPMGFCLLNNVAVAAMHAISLGLDRILIIDWDVHHGNGTQDMFWTDRRVGFFSSHRYPFYPGSGSEDETGGGDGLGYTVNLPLDADVSSATALSGIKSKAEALAQKVQPQLILLSAGFDAHPEDPVGGLCLEEEHFEMLGQWAGELAKHYCDGKLISLLEGGYHLEHMPASVASHLNGIEKALPTLVPRQ